MPQAVWVRSRAGSKTRDLVVLGLYLAYRGYEGVYFASSADQLGRPGDVMGALAGSCFLERLVRAPKARHLLKRSVTFRHGGRLRLKNMTMRKVRSSRADFLLLDEEREMDRELVDAASSILDTSPLALTVHASTPAKGSCFEQSYRRARDLERRYGRRLVLERPWDEIGYLQRGRDRQTIEYRREVWPRWRFRMEYECSFTVPEGAVFRNVKYAFQPEVWSRFDKCPMALAAGLDWNPAGGHWLVAGKYSVDQREFLVMESRPVGEGYAHALTDSFYNRIWPYLTGGDALVCEDGGVNEPYCEKLARKLEEAGDRREQVVLFEEWDSAGVTKVNRATEMRELEAIYCDQEQFPQLAHQLQNAAWDATRTGEPRLAKDPANSPHALDALLHAMHGELRERGDHQIHFPKGADHRRRARGPFEEPGRARPPRRPKL